LFSLAHTIAKRKNFRMSIGAYVQNIYNITAHENECDYGEGMHTMSVLQGPVQKFHLLEKDMLF
jgi:hypothetical protein